MSHMGKPKGMPVAAKKSLGRIREAVRRLSVFPWLFAPDCAKAQAGLLP